MLRSLYILCLAIIMAGCSTPSAKPITDDADDNTSSQQSLPNSIEVEQIDMIISPNQPLTLRDAVRLMVLHNSQLKANTYGIQAAEARSLQAGLWQNPELEVEVENIAGSGDFSDIESAETTIQLSQLIELGGKIDKRKAVYAYDTKLAQNDYQAKQLDISNDLTKTFITLLFIQDKMALSQELLDISTEIVDTIDKSVQSGKISSINLAKAKIGLANAKLQQVDIAKYLSAKRNELASYWNSPQASFANAQGSLADISTLPDLESIQAMLDKNPDIIQHALEIQKRKAEMALADSQATGDITLAGGVRHFNDSDDASLVFGIAIPLGISNRNQGGRLEAYHNYQQSLEQHNVAMITVRNEINMIYADLNAAFHKAMILKEDVLQSAGQVFNASKLSYEQGKANYLELLDAQKTYFSSKNEYIDTLAEYHIARTELERLIGQSINSLQ